MSVVGSYGLVKKHDEQKKIIKKHVVEYGFVMLFLAIAAFAINYIWLGYSIDPFLYIVGWFILYFICAFNSLKVLRIIDSNLISRLLELGSKNQEFRNTIEMAYQRNGCVSEYDLRGILQEIYFTNEALKIDIRAGRTKGNIADALSKYNYNQELIEQIKKIV